MLTYVFFLDGAVNRLHFRVLLVHQRQTRVRELVYDVIDFVTVLQDAQANYGLDANLFQVHSVNNQSLSFVNFAYR